jgi:hypothetical protein
MLPALKTVQQQVFKKAIIGEEGCLDLMKIVINFQDIEKTIIKFIRNMLESFPLIDLGKVTKEDDLKSRYLLPMIQSLFDGLDDNHMTFFKITNENNPPECK